MKEFKELLINWLCQEYEREDAIRQIKNAKITIKRNRVKIKYDNGRFDLIKINEKTNKIKHLNPYPTHE